MSRLDVEVSERGLVKSRSLATKLIRGGFVAVNDAVCTKPSFEVCAEDCIVIRDNPETRYVSRGGLKLEAALDAFSVSPEGKICADIGSSTGGFTDCLLQRGAARVYAVDSGSEQMAASLRKNSKVVLMEKVNARYLNENSFEAVDLAVMDVSFISQSLIYPAIGRILKEDGIFLSLIKPQFEVGRDRIGSGGIVRNEEARKACIERLRLAAKEHSLTMLDCILSPLTGGDGNVEYLACFQKSRKET